MSVVAFFVVLLLVGPLLLIVPGLLVLCGIGLLSGDAPRYVRCRFECPERHRAVTADLAVASGAAAPGLVVACSAFANPARVTCAQRCLAALAARWTAPIGAIGR